MAIKLGTEAADSVTGFKGIVLGRGQCLHGCVKVFIQPKKLTKEGSVLPGDWFDESRVNGETTKDQARSPFLGEKVTDSITGLKGIVVTYAEFFYSGPQVSVQPLGAKMGTPAETQIYDVAQLKEYAKIMEKASPKTIKPRAGGPAIRVPSNARIPRR